jgi:hypothetical protein
MEVEMRVNKTAAAGVVAAATAVWMWSLGMQNPVQDARVTARQAMMEARDASTRREQPSDPLALFASSLVDVSSFSAGIKGTIYVPAYSRIRVGSGRGGVDLATTLSIHNSSRDNVLLLESVSYHNTEGELVQTYLDRAVGLRPLGTIEIFVASADLRGGTGANFVIEWAAQAPIPEPVTEAVMIGSVGATSYSFVSQGRSLRMVAANQRAVSD